MNMLVKAQGAMELLILLALITFVGLIIYSSSQTSLSQSNKLLITSQARATVNDLASAASEVYSEGVGARRKVYVTIPEGVDSARVYANNTMINIGLNLSPNTTTDINTQTTMRVVQGADFPTTPGSYWVYVTAQEGYVIIGNPNININPTILLLTTSPSSSTNAVVTFTNTGATPVSVNLTPQWSYNGTVDLSCNVTNFALYPTVGGSTVYVLVMIQTYMNTTLQPYIGRILVTTNTTETGEISLVVNVVGTQLPAGVSYITIDTFKNSSYSTATTNFTLPKMVNVNGSGWTNGVVTLTINNPSGSSIYSTNVIANTSGSFSYTWNPAGNLAGNYTLIANQSSTSTNTTFNITACS
jgi:hypothetical protein